MKLKLVAGLLLACMIFMTFTILTGCEPNVPDDEEEEPIDSLQPNDNNNEPDNTNDEQLPNETDDMIPDGENDDEDDVLDENDENNDDNQDDDDSLYDDETPAVEGDTSAADFDNNAVEPENTRPLPLSIHRLNSADNRADGNFTHLPSKKIGWGLGPQTDEKNRPIDAVNANQNFGSLGGVFIGEREPVIHLTFDEGYENGFTADILDTLKEKSTKAIFFVTYDYCKSVPELVQRMVDEGHTVANHSYTHPSFPDCSVEQIREEIGKLHDYVKQTFKYDMDLIRFPMGEFSERSLAVAQSMGYTSVFWSFAYMDWDVNRQPEPQASLEKIKAATHPGGIFLFHAVSKTNAEIIGDVIDFWKKEGYSIGNELTVPKELVPQELVRTENQTV